MTDMTAPHGPATEVTTGDRGHPVRGIVRIAPRVLIELIELTVIDIDGVAALRPLRRRATSPTPRAGKTFSDGKVRASIVNDRIDADIAISVVRGANIAALSQSIQRRVAIAISHTLGMTITEINIFVDDIHDPEVSDTRHHGRVSRTP